jgi:hypothetical protein
VICSPISYMKCLFSQTVEVGSFWGLICYCIVSVLESFDFESWHILDKVKNQVYTLKDQVYTLKDQVYPNIWQKKFFAKYYNRD